MLSVHAQEFFLWLEVHDQQNKEDISRPSDTTLLAVSEALETMAALIFCCACEVTQPEHCVSDLHK